ncbi:MAG: PKD domain-containing protein [Candidatus Zixiibacteriota bacterium]|nr:MAG: PKD domain-containing protein [candidate division Zixibacteria bacterium]
MRRASIIALILGILVPCLVVAADVLNVDPAKYVREEGFLGYVPDRFIVILKSNVDVDHARDMRSPMALSDKAGFGELAEAFGVSRVRPQFPGSDRKTGAESLARHYKVYLESGDNIDRAVAAYEAHPMVDHVERIGVHLLHATPNDPYYDDPPPTFPHDQWHYWDTYGVNADSAWDTEAGDQTVVVGDLDIGMKYDHGDLGGSNPPGPDDASTNGNVWINTNEIPGNSVDDDGNGYVDDVLGWDFVERTDWYSYECIDLDCGGADNDPWDGDGHGTHTGGTIAAITNNGYAVAGVAGGYGNGSFSGGGNGVKVVPCRIGYVLDYWIYGPTGVVIMDYVAEAMYYMADLKTSGWNVAAINCSFGSSNSGGIAAAADYLIAQDVIVVVSAGNSNSSSPSYLGGRGDCLDVGATDQSGNPASFSNYGNWVEIAAPGVEVMSTITDPTDPASDYVAYMDGTSMSAPHVTGVVALLESFNPALSAADKFDIITNVNNTRPYNQTKNVGVGIVDARKCLDAAGGGCDLTADFSGSPTSGCVSLTVNFTDQSTGTGIDGWSWDFGDGVGTSAAQNPSYTYTSAGTYTVTLTVSSSSQGCDDTSVKTGYITVNPAPTAAFVGNPVSGTAPLTVNFTDQSSGNPTSWSWDFGDGVGTSADRNPSYTYNNEGTYTVTLTAANACGSDQEQKVDYITVSPCVAPTADFVGTPTTGCVPLTVDFTDQSTGNPTSWNWDFGDGVGSSAEQNPSYTYNGPGTYTVTLTAANACGSDPEVKADYITVNDCPAAKAYANADIPVQGTVGGTFVNTLSSDNSYESITEIEIAQNKVQKYSALEHKWTVDVGAGGADMTFYVEAYRPDNSDGDNFVFAYSTDDALYTDMVTVASASEQVYSASLPAGLTGTVYIRMLDSNRGFGNVSLDAVFIDEMYMEYGGEPPPPEPPVADFVGSPTSGSPPLTVDFIDLSTGSPTSWSWDFGDGVGTSADQNPSYTYNSVGSYTVTLTATNAYGSDDEVKTNYITVAEAGNNMHVHDMVVDRIKYIAQYYGTCTVYIYDDNHNPVSGATVYVTATGPSGGDYNGVTGGDGSAYFQVTEGFKKPSGEWCFEVTNVTHASYTYIAGSNDVTMACESGSVFKDGLAEAVPDTYGLAQNHPNPFNPKTTISFGLPEPGHVSLEVYNIRGRKVTTLANGVYPAGYHHVEWDASAQPSGIYLYRLTTGNYAETRKMLLVK